MEGDSETSTNESIFTRRPGSGRSLSIFSNEDSTPRSSSGNKKYVQSGQFDFSSIADALLENGHVQFEFDAADMQPFSEESTPSSFDEGMETEDPHAPSDPAIDLPSQDFVRCSRSARFQPIPMEEMELITEDGGVRKRVLMEGTGPAKPVTAGCRVWIQYDTYLDNGPAQLILKSSSSEKKVATCLEIGKDGIVGLQWGVMSMRKGEIAEIYMTADYGYGKLGIPNWIGKNQNIRMVVELKEFISVPQPEKFEELVEPEIVFE